MEKFITITTAALPADAPPIPRGYTLHADEQMRIFCRQPADKRKRQGRVPTEPRRWFLMFDEDEDTWVWVQEFGYNTLPVREFMIAQGLRMEIKFGISMTAKAPKASSILRQEYGMKGKPQDLFEQFIAFRKIKLETLGTEK